MLCFPGLFRGALDARAVRDHRGDEAGGRVRDRRGDPRAELSEEYIIPSVFDRRVAEAVAQAVADEARRAGVSRSGSVLETTAAGVRASAGA